MVLEFEGVMLRLDVLVGVADFEGVVVVLRLALGLREAVGLGLGTNWQQPDLGKVQARSSKLPSVVTATQS